MLRSLVGSEMCIRDSWVCLVIGVQVVKQRLKLDDSLDVFPVHGIAGVVGTILTGIFASSELGIFSGQGMDTSIISQIVIQIIGVTATVVYTVIVTFVIFKVTGLLVNGLRVDEESEVQGLDVSTHDERGYHF